MGKPRNRFRDAAEDAVVRAFVGAVLALPYERRVPAMGWVGSHLIAPVAGWRARVRDNLAYACPNLDEAEVRRLTRAVPDNVGRTLIEFYSGSAFIERAAKLPVEGPGFAALEAAKNAGRPVIAVSGHFGNYEVVRAALGARGMPMGALYRPMSNAKFNAHYVRSMERFGKPLFAKDRRGFGELLRFLKSGGTAAMLIDLFVHRGAPVTFFGRTAPTALSAAELALRLDAPLIPMYAIRQPDGLSFRIVIEAPIPPSDPMTMTQAINDSLEVQVRAHMDQWFWLHRRWKPEVQRSRAAARMAP